MQGKPSLYASVPLCRLTGRPMAEKEPGTSNYARKLLAFLSLLLMGAGVWYFIYGRTVGSITYPEAAPEIAAFKQSSPAPAPALTAVPAAVRLPEAYNPKLGIDIQGPPEFVSQVTHALKLIWMADRETFLFLKKNISVIRNETQTGFYIENGLPVAALSKAQAFRSLTWCAGILAHQGWHAWYTMTKNRKSRPAPPLPGDKDEREMDINPARFDYKGLNAILYIEDRASAFQLTVLKKVGAPYRETNPVARRGPRDFQYAHDGNYALNP